MEVKDPRLLITDLLEKMGGARASPYSGMGRPERGHKGGEGERGMKDTGKDTPSIRRINFFPFYVVWCFFSNNSSLTQIVRFVYR